MKRISELFGASKIAIQGKAKIIHTNDGKYVVKSKNKNIVDLYDYLSIRDFNSYPRIIDECDEGYIYEHLSDVKIPINQKAADMANLLASLHAKTLFNKPITSDYIKRINEEVENNILFMENYYENLYDQIKNRPIMSPSEYLLIRNSSKINLSFTFCKNELEKWLKMVEGHTKERVVYCHNNLTIDHYLKNISDAFISWDNYCVDTPVLDLYNLYHKDYMKYDFSNFLEIYNNRFPLTEEEKKLFFVLIAMPYQITLDNTEFNNTKIVNNLLTYIYKTENLVRSNYAPQNVEQ